MGWWWGLEVTQAQASGSSSSQPSLVARLTQSLQGGRAVSRSAGGGGAGVVGPLGSQVV